MEWELKCQVIFANQRLSNKIANSSKKMTTGRRFWSSVNQGRFFGKDGVLGERSENFSRRGRSKFNFGYSLSDGGILQTNLVGLMKVS